MVIKNVTGLVSGTTFKKNTESLHGILLTHVYAILTPRLLELSSVLFLYIHALPVS